MAASRARRSVERLKRDGPLVLLDLVIAFCAYLIALFLRFEGAVDSYYWSNFWGFIGLALGIHIVCNAFYGLYGRIWRHASAHEARLVVFAGITGMAVVVAASTFSGNTVRTLPLSVLILGSGISAAGFGAVRFQSRLFGAIRPATRGTTRVVIAGAGEAGAMLLRDIVRHPALQLEVVGLVDDDHRKRGLRIQGHRVLGDLGCIPALATSLGVDQVLLAIPSATSEVVLKVASLCERVDVELKILPSVGEIIGGRVSAHDIRELRIEDLLGRQQVDIDLDAVAALIRGRRVLVTGAGGSIGSEIAEQVFSFGPASLVLLDHDETHLYDVMVTVPDATPVLADIRDRDRVRAAFAQYRPEIVFHAAAHKHVPLLEEHPEEAFETNVAATATVAEAAVENGTERFILISTDKAVLPKSAMGASKRLAEQVIWAMQEGRTRFCAVRFGNVLGSRGSVVPTFFKQIARGGPVTVTDPRMTRYFMSVREAVQLVLQAAALARGGEIFTLDMGVPVNILDLAQKVIRLTGRIPEQEIEIEITGLRPGEKLHEDVVDKSEATLPSAHESILVSRPPAGDVQRLRRQLDALQELARSRSSELCDRMKELATSPVHLRSVPNSSDDVTGLPSSGAGA